MCVCVCVRVCVTCVRARARACVCVRARAQLHARVVMCKPETASMMPQSTSANHLSFSWQPAGPLLLQTCTSPGPQMKRAG